MDLNYASYENRQGILPVSWQDFHGLCRGLALAAVKFDPQVILGIARGGVYAGALISHLLQRDFYAIYLTRRRQDQKVSEQPVWNAHPPQQVAGLRVLVVDEICHSGETLRMAKEELLRMGAGAVRCAVLYAHSWGVDTPDYIGLVSDALIINPWDREIIQDDQVVDNPEYVYALELQKISPASVFAQDKDTIYRPAKYPRD
jgi:hypoxanthine phosphoribosyltransferase